MNEVMVLWVTVSNTDEGERLAKSLVEEGLVACVNMVDGIRSFYQWEGKICDDQEVLLMIKTTRQNLERTTRRVVDLHSYDLPEVIALPVEGGNPDYIKWVLEACTTKGNG